MELNKELIGKRISLENFKKFYDLANGGQPITNESVLEEFAELEIVRVVDKNSEAYIASDTLDKYVAAIPVCDKDLCVYDPVRGVYSREWILYENELSCFKFAE